MIQNFGKMLFVGLILLLITPSSVFANDPSAAGAACTGGLVVCGTGCYNPTLAELCCHGPSGSSACPYASAASSLSNAITKTMSTTEHLTETSTSTVDDTDSESAVEPATTLPAHSYPSNSIATVPVDASASCAPFTVTITTASVFTIVSTTQVHHSASSEYNSGTPYPSTDISIGTETGLTSITASLVLPSSSKPGTIFNTPPSSDVAGTIPASSTTLATISATVPSSPGQPVISYTPGNGGHDATVPSIFAMYMGMMGLVFI